MFALAAYLDSGLQAGTTFSYTVQAVDTSGNLSEPSTVVFAETRHPSLSVPSLTGASYEVDDNGTPVDPEAECTVWFEGDDILGIRVDWTSTNQSVFRIYRAVGSDVDYSLVYETTAGDWGSGEICDGSPGNYSCSFFDGPLGGLDYTYYVVSYGDVGGTNYESAASTPQFVQGDFDESEATVRAILIDDGRVFYSTDNSRSRLDTVQWSRVVQPNIQGYHVYRSCEWNGCGGYEPYANLRTPNCIHAWVRLTDQPVTQTKFTDTTVGGLGGCVKYAVRPVGTAGEEGPVTRVVRANLFDEFTQQTTGKYCQEWPLDIDVKEQTPTSEDERITDIAKGTVPSGGTVQAPTITDSGRAMQKEYTPSEPPWPSSYAWISWERNLKSDLAGYYVEQAGSTAGPWKRVTPNPVAWWETRFELKGTWIKLGEFDEEYRGPECVVLRLIAVNDDGVESAPSASVEIPAGCSLATPTVGAPTVVVPSTSPENDGRGGLCATKLAWPQVPDADEYHVYRYMLKTPNRAYYFYPTATIDHTACTAQGCEFVEIGDPTHDPWESDDFCPWWTPGWAGTGTECYNLNLQAFYVTAAKDGEPESPPSDLVFWDCNEDPGYARLESDDTWGDALASLPPLDANTPGPPVCPVDGSTGVWPADALHAVAENRPEAEDTELLVAPLLRLGQSGPAIPFAVYDIHVDHLGSTRVVTDEAGQVVSLHDFYPFGEEVAEVFDYNTKMFTGHERDEETGLDYMLARYYGDDLPRFLSPDPGESWDEYEPQSWNLYTYVGNNPVAYIDSNGEEMIYSVELEINVNTSAQLKHQHGITDPGILNGHWKLDPSTDIDYGFNPFTGDMDVTFESLMQVASDGVKPFHEVLEHEFGHQYDFEAAVRETGNANLDRSLQRTWDKWQRKAQRKGWSQDQANRRAWDAVTRKAVKEIRKIAKKYNKKKKKRDPNSMSINPGNDPDWVDPCKGQPVCGGM